MACTSMRCPRENVAGSDWQDQNIRRLKIGLDDQFRGNDVADKAGHKPDSSTLAADMKWRCDGASQCIAKRETSFLVKTRPSLLYVSPH